LKDKPSTEERVAPSVNCC